MLIVGLTDAVATGLFTLGGVFLGALAGAGLEYLRGRRADRKEARRATRLVLLELGVLTKLTDLYFERAEQAARAETPKDREYWERLEARVSEDLDHYGPIPPAWNEHRGTLAEILPDHAWKKIESATRMLEINRGCHPRTPTGSATSTGGKTCTASSTMRRRCSPPTPAACPARGWPSPAGVDTDGDAEQAAARHRSCV